MEEVRNDERQDHFKFNREIAKSSMSKILSKIFPALMSYGMGEKVSNTNKSNLQRATKEATLLNALSFSKIIVSAYSLRSTYEVRNHISGCKHLGRYLEDELGELYTDQNHQDKMIDYALLNTVTDSASKELYGLIYARKRMNITTLEMLYGKDLAESLITKFLKYDIATYHESLNSIVFNEKMVSSGFAHNKNQLEITASNISEAKINNKEAVYGHDTLLLDKDGVETFLNSFTNLVQEKNEQGKQLEGTKGGTELVEYVIIAQKTKTVSFSELEVEQ